MWPLPHQVTQDFSPELRQRVGLGGSPDQGVSLQIGGSPKPPLTILPFLMSGGGCSEVQGPLQSPADEKGPSQFSLLAGNAPAGFPSSQYPAKSF